MRAERRRGQKTIYGQRRTRQRVRARCARSPVTPFRNTIFAELPPRADWAGACAERFGGLRLTSSAVSLPLAPSFSFVETTESPLGKHRKFRIPAASSHANHRKPLESLQTADSHPCTVLAPPKDWTRPGSKGCLKTCQSGPHNGWSFYPGERTDYFLVNCPLLKTM